MFRRRAVELSNALRTLWPNIEITLNSKVPRRGAFEFVLTKSDGSDVLIWSGIEKGPPRKEKFPEPEKLIRALKAAL